MPRNPHPGRRTFRITYIAAVAIAATLTNAFCYLEIDRPLAQWLGTHFVSGIVAALAIGALAFSCVRELFCADLPD